MNDLISVIIPVYNMEKYLEQCVNSILNQTYKNIEIILVDDGSVDKSSLICDKYEQNYSNISVIHKKNEGLGKARNTGIEIATGKYVYFHDADDYISADEIEIMYNLIQKYKVDVCIAGYTSVDDSGKVFKTRKYKEEYFSGDEARTKLFPRMIGSAPGIKDSFEMASAGTMYSMDVIKKNNIRFVSERELKNEDLVFNMEFMQFANGGCSSESVGAFYRYNPKSISHKYHKDRFIMDKNFYTIMVKKLKEKGYGRSEIERLQRNFFIHLLINIQHANNKENNNYISDRYRDIKEICTDSLVQDTIAMYPCNKLGFKQRIFLFLIRHRCVWMLILCIK